MHQEREEIVEKKIEKKQGKSWLKKVGKIGFWFFLLKGIGWLVLGFLAYLGFDNIIE